MKTTTLTLTDNCPKCGTKTLELDQEGDIHCWGCGSTHGKPEKGKRDYLLERHQFYEKNKVAILKDVKSLGEKATAKRWNVTGASLYHVLQRWAREAVLKKRRSFASERIRDVWLYNEKNKDAIIADLFAIGNTATCKKWGIKSQTMAGLKKRWLTEEERAKIFWEKAGRRIPGHMKTISRNGQLPDFPEFCNSWEAPVQLKWLELYEKLFNRHSSENN